MSTQCEISWVKDLILKGNCVMSLQTLAGMRRRKINTYLTKTMKMQETLEILLFLCTFKCFCGVTFFF